MAVEDHIHVENTRALVLLEEMSKRMERGDKRFDEISAQLGVMRQALEEAKNFNAQITLGYKFVTVIATIIGFAVTSALAYMAIK